MPEPAGPSDPATPRQNGAAADIEFNSQGLPVFAREAQRIAYVTTMIRGGLFPSHITTVSQALSSIDLLTSMGLPWRTFIAKTYVIGGKPAVMIEALQAAAEATGEVEYLRVEYVDAENKFLTKENFVKFEVFGCVVTGKRRGQSHEQMATYTLDDVKKAGFTNQNYTKHPKDMLMWRAMGRCLKMLWPLTCGGPLAQGINDGYEAMLDADGTPVRTADGQDVMVRRPGRLDAKSLNSMFASEGVKKDES